MSTPHLFSKGMSNSSAAALVDQGTPLEPWRKRFDDTRALEVLLRLLAALPSPIDGTAMLNAAAAADHSSPSLAAVAPATEGSAVHPLMHVT